MGALSGLGSAAPSLKDPYFIVGSYRVQLVDVKLYHSTKDNTDMFIVRGKIVSTNTTLPPGTVCAWIVKISGNKSALGNIKAFIAACVGYDTSDAAKMAEIDDKMAEELIETKALEGLVLDLVCTNTKTTKGGDFTIHTWTLPSVAK